MSYTCLLLCGFLTWALGAVARRLTTRATRRKYAVLCLAMCVLSASALGPFLAGSGSSKKASTQLRPLRQKVWRKRRRPRKRNKTGFSDDRVRGTTCKRGDAHFNCAGGISGSFLTQPKTHGTRYVSREDKIRDNEEVAQRARQAAAEHSHSRTRRIRQRRSPLAYVCLAVVVATLAAKGEDWQGGPPCFAMPHLGNGSETGWDHQPTAFLSHDPLAGKRIGEAPYPGPQVGAFDDFDDALQVEEEHHGEMEPPGEFGEPPDLASESESEDEGAAPPVGEIAPRLEIGLTARMNELWANAEKAFK